MLTVQVERHQPGTSRAQGDLPGSTRGPPPSVLRDTPGCFRDAQRILRDIAGAEAHHTRNPLHIQTVASRGDTTLRFVGLSAFRAHSREVDGTTGAARGLTTLTGCGHAPRLRPRDRAVTAGQRDAVDCPSLLSLDRGAADRLPSDQSYCSWGVVRGEFRCPSPPLQWGFARPTHHLSPAPCRGSQPPTTLQHNTGLSESHPCGTMRSNASADLV